MLEYGFVSSSTSGKPGAYHLCLGYATETMLAYEDKERCFILLGDQKG